MTALALSGARPGGSRSAKAFRPGRVGGGPAGASGDGASAAEAAVAPMSEMNTTPLIDVMLVLLIMFIITVPMSTHAVKLDLPSGPPVTKRIDPVVNEVAIDRTGAVRWNAAAVDRAELQALLAASAGMKEEPELHFVPDAEAPYAVVDSVLADAKRANVRRMGFVGNQTYARAF